MYEQPRLFSSLQLLSQEKYDPNNPLQFFFLIFLPWKSIAAAGWSFPLCSFIWIGVMPTMYFLLFPCETPVAPRLSPVVKMDYSTRIACPALYVFLTHQFSIISFIRRGKQGEGRNVHAQTHGYTHGSCNTRIHTGLKALTGLLSEGRSHESDKSFFFFQGGIDLLNPAKVKTQWQLFFFVCLVFSLYLTPSFSANMWIKKKKTAYRFVS